jgi:hypothetical protein
MLRIDLKKIVQQCADEEDVEPTLASLYQSRAKRLTDFNAMNVVDLEDTIKNIPTVIRSKLRDALSHHIKQGTFALLRLLHCFRSSSFYSTSFVSPYSLPQLFHS